MVWGQGTSTVCCFCSYFLICTRALFHSRQWTPNVEILITSKWVVDDTGNGICQQEQILHLKSPDSCLLVSSTVDFNATRP